ESTVKNLSLPRKIMVHLFSYRPDPGEYVLPVGMTQYGIGKAIGVRRSQVSAALKTLVEKGTVEVSKVHIAGCPRRLNAYRLTDIGRGAARNVLGGLLDTIVSVVEDGTRREKTLGALVSDLSLSPIEVLKMLDIDGTIDPSDMSMGVEENRKEPRVFFAEEVPTSKHIVGREGEKEEMLEWLSSSDSGSYVVYGIAGIGKTCEVREVVEEMKDERSVFWFTADTWTTPRSFLRKLGEYLSMLDLHKLSTMLEGGSVELEVAKEMMTEASSRAPQIMVVDDVQKISDLDICSLLMKAAAKKGTHLILISRDVPGCYDRREVRLKKKVWELELDALGPEAGLHLLSDRGVLDISEAKAIYKWTGGHPLAMELSASSPTGDMRDVLRFFREEVVGKLSKAEMNILFLASLFRKPIPIDAIFLGGGTFNDLDLLLDRSLMVELEGGYRLHDVLSEVVDKRLTPSKRRELHSLAACSYAKEIMDSGLAEDVLEAVYHYINAGLSSDAARILEEHADSFLEQGFQYDALEAISDMSKNDLEGELIVSLGILSGSLLVFIGKIPEAKRILEKILETIPTDSQDRAKALNAMGVAHYKEGKMDEAMAFYTTALEAAEKEKNKEQMARAIGHIAVVHADKGNMGLAIEAHRRDMEISESRGDKRGMARAHNNIGVLYHMEGRYELALDMFQKTCKLAEEEGARHTVAIGLNNLGDTYRCMGDIQNAHLYFKKGLEEARDRRYPWEEAEALFYLGQMCEGAEREQLLLRSAELYHTLGTEERASEARRLLDTQKSLS
ncbi:MAG: tetratricopeptide repeat protein, partial [Thermoplasmata archaeon]|nr:tetratricopeptide repeat protein [Thermoplasmata archaeon]